MKRGMDFVVKDEVRLVGADKIEASVGVGCDVSRLVYQL